VSRSSPDAIFIPGHQSLWFPATGVSPYAAAAGELDAELPLDVDSAANQVRDFITAIDAAS
jgi:hypothetical protein